MKSMSAAEAKQGFGHLIDQALQGPVKIERHGRPVVVVLSVEEFERLNRRAENRRRIENKTRKEAGE